MLQWRRPRVQAFVDGAILIQETLSALMDYEDAQGALAVTQQRGECKVSFAVPQRASKICH